MKIIFLLLAFISTNALAAQAKFVAKLSPAGSFTATMDDVTGHAVLKGETVSAKDIKVKLTNLKTGIELRDKHTKEHLKTDKYPFATLINAIGSKGKGTATIEIMGKQKAVSGTYSIKGNVLTAEFPLKISDYGIAGVKYLGVGVKDEVQITVQVPVSAK